MTGAVFLEISVIILRGRRSTSDMSHCVLHTLHSTLYTPHSTRYALYTPHFTLYTPHSPLYTPHSTLLHSTLNTLLRHFTLQPPNFALHPLPHSAVYSALVLQEGRMYKTVQITCFTKVFYVTAFGFVGCILFCVQKLEMVDSLLTMLNI